MRDVRITSFSYLMVAGILFLTLLAGCRGNSSSSEATLQSIEVTPANPGIANNTTKQFTATGVFSDGTFRNITASVTWNSSNTGVATVISSGYATGVAAGTAAITATSGAISGSTSLTVTPVSAAAGINWTTAHTALSAPPLNGIAWSPCLRL